MCCDCFSKRSFKQRVQAVQTGQKCCEYFSKWSFKQQPFDKVLVRDCCECFSKWSFKQLQEIQGQSQLVVNASQNGALNNLVTQSFLILGVVNASQK